MATMSRSIDCSQPFLSERIPAEIWLQIMECSSLEQDDIANLSLVGRHLRYVIQPILFSEIRVTLIQARYLDTYAPVRCQHVDYYDRLKKRLEFATSNHIAYYVKALTFRVGGERLDVETQDAIKEEQVLRTVFDELHHFVNLRSFSAQDISLDGTHFDSLARLEYFNGIHLERCTCSGDLGLTRFKLKSLSLHGKMNGSYGWWIPLVTSSSVEHLSYDAPALSSTETEPEILFPALAVFPHQMRSLRTLRLPAYAPFFPCFARALARCSSVENLYIDQNGPSRHDILAQVPLLAQTPDGYPSLSRNTLPKLKAIGAPSSFIQCLIMSCVGQANFKHISIWGRSHDIIEILQLIRDRCRDVEEIVVDLPPLNTITTLELLLTDLPALRGLFVQTDVIHVPYKKLYGYMKTTTYPPNLRSLHIESSQVDQETLLQSRRRFSASSASEPATPGKTRSALISHIRKQAPGVVEIEILLEKPIVWRDVYTRRVKWYEWDNHGGRAALP